MTAEWLATHIALLWSALGVVFLLLEMAILPGVGLFFGALAALLVSVLLVLEHIPNADFITQLSLFMLATTGFALLLWRPMKRFRSGQGQGYSNMIGTSVFILPDVPLEQGVLSRVKWSGTEMRARLHPLADARYDQAGQELMVLAVEGNTLIVGPASIATTNQKEE